MSKLAIEISTHWTGWCVYFFLPLGHPVHATHSELTYEYHWMICYTIPLHTLVSRMLSEEYSL